MPRFLCFLLLLSLLAGCSTAPEAVSVVGYYASGTIAPPTTRPDGRMTDWTAGDTAAYHLFLHADGRYAASGQRFRSGQLVRSGSRSDFSLREYSTGTWTQDGDRLVLRSNSAQLGSATARVVHKGDGWHILWDQIEYVQQLPDSPDGRASLTTSDPGTFRQRRETTSSAEHR